MNDGQYQTAKKSLGEAGVSRMVAPWLDLEVANYDLKMPGSSVQMVLGWAMDQSSRP